MSAQNPVSEKPPPDEATSPDRKDRFAWSDDDLPYLIVHRAELFETAPAPPPART